MEAKDLQVGSLLKSVRSRHNREGFYHTDGLGSTRAITDNVGLVTDRYTYDAFGELLNQTGTFGNSLQFAGQQGDSATGLGYCSFNTFVD